MARDSSAVNGAGPRRSGGALADELHHVVLPQAAALLADAEIVVRQEVKLLEARVLHRVNRVEARLVTSTLAVGALLAAFALLLVTLYFASREFFPQVPPWAVTAVLTLAMGAVGGYLLSSDAATRKFNAEE